MKLRKLETCTFFFLFFSSNSTPNFTSSVFLNIKGKDSSRGVFVEIMVVAFLLVALTVQIAKLTLVILRFVLFHFALFRFIFFFFLDRIFRASNINPSEIASSFSHVTMVI